MIVATAIVFLSGNHGARRAADAAALKSQLYPRRGAADASSQ
jgi:hypothetical protein